MSRLYVGNLSWNTTDDSLREAFSEAGKVKSATVMIDRETNRSRGFGFVEFDTPEEANTAIDRFNDQELDGRRIRVSEARANRGGAGGGGSWR
ncbi:hypothetical protein FDECE_3239 [Fusarium decemcellulare]|nr:hypothetical protein FDECE_3239 [Fusarium decemcellulare]